MLIPGDMKEFINWVQLEREEMQEIMRLIGDNERIFNKHLTSLETDALFEAYKRIGDQEAMLIKVQEKAESMK